jgi:small-conductance mechanosensitive channel
MNRFFTSLLLLLSSLHAFAQGSPADSTAAVLNRKTGYPVIAYGDTLFFIYEPTFSLAAEERATLVSNRIKMLQRSSSFHVDSFFIEHTDLSSNILYKDLPVLAVTYKDAQRANTSKEQLADQWLKDITGSVLKFREVYSWQKIIKTMLMAGALIAAIALIIYLISFLFRKLSGLAENKITARLHRAEFGKVSLENVQKTTRTILTALKWFKVMIILLIIYVSLPAFIYLVPASRTLTKTLLKYTLDPLIQFIHEFINFIPNLITILVIIGIFQLFIRLLKFLAHQIQISAITIRGFYPDWAFPTLNIFRFILYAFMFIIIFPYLPGSDSPVFQGVSVFLGVLLSLGSAGSISNMMAGIMITYMRSFQLGDRIRVGDSVGDVVEKSLLVTRIRTIKNEEITIPNSSIMSTNVMNFTVLAKENKLIIYTSVTIGYDTPWPKVHEALIRAAHRTPAILQSPEPFILQRALNDFNVEYQVNGYTSDAQHLAQTYSDLHQHIQDSFNEAGLEIMSPHYSSLRDGNKTTIPAGYLPGDYRTPGFKMESQND